MSSIQGIGALGTDAFSCSLNCDQIRSVKLSRVIAYGKAYSAFSDFVIIRIIYHSVSFHLLCLCAVISLIKYFLFLWLFIGKNVQENKILN